MNIIPECLIPFISTFLSYQDIINFSKVSKINNLVINIYERFIWDNIIKNFNEITYLEYDGNNNLRYENIVFSFSKKLSKKIAFIEFRKILLSKKIII